MVGKKIVVKAALVCMVVASVFQAQAITPEEMVLSQVSKYVNSAPEAASIAQEICDASYAYNVDPILVAAVFTTESHFDNTSRSSVGAVGIAQLMPDTAAMLHVNPYDRKQNIIGGVKYLGQMVDRYKTWDKPFVYAEAAYNAGPGAVDGARGVPHYEETMNYVQTVEQTRSDIWKMAGREAGGFTYGGPSRVTAQKAEVFPSLKEWNDQKAEVTQQSKHVVPAYHKTSRNSMTRK
ncbi:MAG: lytic transglycosylase domain-containing protein [Megasphaera sp.]|jgi:hypothetical protein|nr:lytic transglycosylase domain-containing protein [Megasphaera sp.]MCH4187756.1 lytic transglycosylase domain-containing protein [Megasphaera sp.]MCH4217809.1 lytic transglycosylase domain-containing protein [Megasphaera sp.]